MQCRCKQVAPAETPKDRALDPGENAGEENRRARAIRKIRAIGNFVESPGGKAAAG